MRKKAMKYKRISVKDQSNFSVPEQDRHIDRYAEDEHIDIVASFTDKGRSAKNFDRPDWKRLEEFVREHHRNVDYLIVIKYDRFSRNAAEGLQKIEWLEQKYKIRIVSVFERMFIDYESPFYFKQRADLLVAAEFELRSIRERTKFGINGALRAGRYINMAPFGYKNGRDEKNKDLPKLYIVEEKAKIVRLIFSMYIAGSSIIEIYRTAKAEGLTMHGNSAIPRILNNCVYAGLIYAPAYKKEAAKYIKAVHEPIIQEHIFWQVQERMGKITNKRSVLSPEFPLRGILKDSCGKPLTAANSTGKSGKLYGYYKCNDHPKVNYSATKLHLQFDDMLDHFSLQPYHVDELTKMAHEEMYVQLEERDKNISELKKQLQLVLNNIESLEEKFITANLAPETYNKWYSKFTAEESAIRYQLQKHERKTDDNWQLMKDQLPKLTDIKYLYHQFDIAQKRTFVRTVFNSHLWYEGGVYRTPFLLPLLSHNELILKEKGLLFIEQPRLLLDEKVGCTRDGS